MAQSSVFAKAYAAGRGTPSSARSSGSAGRGAQPKAAAGSKVITAAPSSKAGAGSKIVAAAPAGKAGKAPAPSKPAAKAKAGSSEAGADQEDEEQGVLTCANRGLLQKMLRNANISENDVGGEDKASDDGADADGSDDNNHDDDDDDDDDDGLSMSLRNVSQFNPMGQPRNVPTISSPPARPVSRGGAPGQTVRPISRGGLESQAMRPASRSGLEIQTHDPRPASRNGPAELQRGRHGPDGASIHVVTTGGPKPAAATFVSMARPGSRGAGGSEIPVSGGEICSRQQPVQRPAPIRAAPATSVRQPPGAGYANLHQARGRKPASPAAPQLSAAAKPAARPLCGPSAFQFLKNLDDAKKAQASPAQESQAMSGSEDEVAQDMSDQDQGGFIMPASDAESDDSDRPRNLRHQPTSATPSSDAAADYVEQVKRGFGLAADNGFVQPDQLVPNKELRVSNQSGGVAAAFAELGLPPPEAVAASGSVQSARSRSSDPRQPSIGGSGKASTRTLTRSRSSDPRAAVAAARLAAAQDSDYDDDDDDDDANTGQAIRWKADVRSMVKSFAQEERAKAAKQAGTTASKPSGDSGVITRKPPRVPAPAVEQNRRFQVEDEQPIAVVSKKPRAPVDYTPATIDAYKQKYGAAKPEKSELGHLGPDLDDDNLLMKKAVQNKVKEFSKELHRINRQRSLATSEKPKPAPKPEPKSNARSKALEYAQNIPKPKVQAQPKVVVTSSLTKTSEEAQNEVDWEDIRRREQQHFEDVAKVAQVKEFLAKLPF